MKLEYEHPMMVIVSVDSSDIVCMSPGEGNGNEGGSTGWGELTY